MPAGLRPLFRVAVPLPDITQTEVRSPQKVGRPYGAKKNNTSAETYGEPQTLRTHGSLAQALENEYSHKLVRGTATREIYTHSYFAVAEKSTSSRSKSSRIPGS